MFSRDSYNALTQWLSDARTLASQHIVVILVGNKKDLESEREVALLEASRFAQENGNVKKSKINQAIIIMLLDKCYITDYTLRYDVYGNQRNDGRKRRRNIPSLCKNNFG